MARTPAQRGTLGNWLKRKREERYPAQAAALADFRRLAGLHIAPSEYAQWESGSRIPQPDNPKVLGLFEFFGGRPDEEPVLAPSAQAVDLTPIVAAIDRQTDALERRTKALDREAKITEALIANVGRRLDLMEKAQEQRFLALTEALADLLRPPTTDAGAGTGPGGEPTHPGSGRIRVATGQ